MAKRPRDDAEQLEDRVSSITVRSDELTIDLVHEARMRVGGRANVQAERRLVIALYGRIHRAARRGLVRRLSSLRADINQEAEDLVQRVLEVFSRDGWAKLLGFDPTRGVPFGGYVSMLSWFAVASILAESTATIGPHLLQHGTMDQAFRDDENVDEALAAEEVRAAFREWMPRHLSPKDREVFLAIYVRGEEVAEVARALDTTAAAIHTACNRIRHRAADFADMFMSGARLRRA